MSEWALSNLELTRKVRELEDKIAKLEAELKILKAKRGRTRK